ncbi:MAG TPA: hypothetical protein EYP57_03565 [Thermodesulfobacteriaceae bacterium]|nr:hypothetical protein [Thermodesulfobacteriaceae bacterium]
MIRLVTFIKYAGIHLEEARTALQAENLEKAAASCSDMAVALVKALDSALPYVTGDFMEMDEKGLGRALSELTGSLNAARNMARDILELRNLKPCSGCQLTRREAESAFLKADRLFASISECCAVRP